MSYEHPDELKTILVDAESRKKFEAFFYETFGIYPNWDDAQDVVRFQFWQARDNEIVVLRDLVQTLRRQLNNARTHAREDIARLEVKIKVKKEGD